MIIKEINNQKVFIDEVDKDLFEAHKWNISNGYAVSYKKKKQINLHSLIMGKKKDLYIDHIDRNRLNNCRNNLDFVTPRENSCNSGPRGGTSKSKGVIIFENGKCKVEVQHNYTKVYIATCEDELTAAIYYDISAYELQGKCAYNNIDYNSTSPETKIIYKQVLNDPNRIQQVSKAKKKAMKIKPKSSKYLGVWWAGETINPWKSRIKIKGKDKYLGRFKTEIEAAKAYDNALIASDRKGKLNFPDN